MGVEAFDGVLGRYDGCGDVAVCLLLELLEVEV